MSNLIHQLWNWINGNRDIIDLVVGAVILIVIIVFEIFSIKNKTTIAKMQGTIEKLSDAIKEYDALIIKLDEMGVTLSNYEGTTNKSINKMINVQDVDTQLLKKINTILDIMGLAYSTVKNDEVRLGIANMINYAKYLDPTNKLIEEREKERQSERRKQSYENIKNNLQNKIKQINNEAAVAQDKPATQAEKTQPKDNVVRRY